MVSWFRALLPAVPVILNVAREVRRQRGPVPPSGPVAGGLEVEAAIARTTEALEKLTADLEQVAARQAALERRLDVIVIALWMLAGVVVVVAIGFLVHLARA